MKRVATIIGLLACIGGLLWVGLVGARHLLQRASLRQDAASLRSAIAQNPSDAAPHIYLAHVLGQLGNYQDALKESQTAIRMDPDEPLYHSEFGEVLWRVGKQSDALREFVLAADLGESQGQDKELASTFSAHAGKVLEEAGRYENAERHYEMALAQLLIVDANLGADPVTAATQPQRAKLRQSVESHLSMVKSRVTPGRPSRDWIVRHISYLKMDAWKHGDTEKEVVEALALTQTSPKSDIGWFNLGWAYLWQGRLDAAADAFDKAHALGDKEADISAADARRASLVFKKASGKK